MPPIFAIICFLILFSIVFNIAYKRFAFIARNIQLGEKHPITGSTYERWKNMLLVALGQKKMFTRPIPAVLHLFIYGAFMITQIELIEILYDGFTGSHRAFAPFLGGFYGVIISTIEIFSILAFVATVAFLWRRNMLKLPRFNKPELDGWPRLDANLILAGEIMLITFIFMMNGADVILQEDMPEHYHHAGPFAISQYLGPILFGWIHNPNVLVLIERIGWWGHVIVVFAFICYLSWSKHLHIILAFPTTWYARLNPKGEIGNMPAIQQEVASMMNPDAAFAAAPASNEIPKFGAADVFDLPRHVLLAAYSCTECGRCTSVCPANLTGKKLSPRKIVMDVRDRMEEIGYNLDQNRTEFINAKEKGKVSTLTPQNYDDKRSLFDYISTEELRACTTCNACADACPININPLEMIVELRRNLILEKSDSPESWNGMFNNLENNGAPWAFPASERTAWVNE